MVIKLKNVFKTVICMTFTISMRIFDVYFILRPTLHFYKFSIRGLIVFSSQDFHYVALVNQKVHVSSRCRSCSWIRLESSRRSKDEIPRRCRTGSPRGF